MNVDIVILLSAVVAGAAPILLATLGETITERAGIINLSLDGSILLSAMAAFVVATQTGSLLLGFVCAGSIGSLTTLVVAFFGLSLRVSQVAVGFVLTLMTKDLAYFLGSPYARQAGLQVGHLPVPYLEHIPGIGPVLFQHSLPVYLALAMIFFVWFCLYRTNAGLILRAVGENPSAAYARGINPIRVRYLACLFGGLLVGLAGASFSLCIKPGWGQPQGAEGTGWIALALVIFGGWGPLKAAFGAFLFAFLQVISINLQDMLPGIPTQVFQVAPFPIMIFALLLVTLAQHDNMQKYFQKHPLAAGIIQAMAAKAPGSLGKPWTP